MGEPYVPVPAKLSATVLIVRDDPFEVLMVRRRKGNVFNNALVFPGGLADPEDHHDDWLPLVSGADDLDVQERALRIAALRETYEETGLLIVGEQLGPCGPDLSFEDAVRASGGKLALDRVVRFAHWVTPERGLKRFDTHFFIVRAPDGQDAACDGREAVAIEWLPVGDAVARAEADISFMLPTRLNLRLLSYSADADSAIAAAEARPHVRVMPTIEDREDGMYSILPEEAGYGVTAVFLREVGVPIHGSDPAGRGPKPNN
ncbi:NUDIX hydrolase [Sphingomonas crocodyli]|uniref:NUDIX hydrolase n=1 Tax=Sphingomonas crocodyli TaxID=1979270 RepID=A0A437M5C9_9SPHN|nr:NUDIX hydrolase [Sphingomonas crocodyli]RVT92887.1 NUDIX hydrolase [Sphingomonas crocodyli]